MKNSLLAIFSMSFFFYSFTFCKESSNADSIEQSNIRNEKSIPALQAIPLAPGNEKRLNDEDELIGTFIKELMKKQGRHIHGSGKRDSGTHAKGICFYGMFRTQTRAELVALGYEGSLIESLKQGIFAPDREYVTELRFSNAERYRNPDNVVDVRGISLSLDLKDSFKDHSGESTQDFIANNSVTFPVKGLADFMPFFLFVTFLETKDPRYFPSPLKMGDRYSRIS